MSKVSTAGPLILRAPIGGLGAEKSPAGDQSSGARPILQDCKEEKKGSGGLTRGAAYRGHKTIKRARFVQEFLFLFEQSRYGLFSSEKSALFLSNRHFKKLHNT